MTAINRRSFILTTALALGLQILSGFGNTDIKQNKCFLNDTTLGLITMANNPEEDFKTIRDLGFSTCQLEIKEYSPKLAKVLPTTLPKFKISPTTLICMGPGSYKWNFTEVPSTICLIPPEFREARIKRLYDGINFCKEVGFPAVHAHFGFIPENLIYQLIFKDETYL